jgi:hypothetical protein
MVSRRLLVRVAIGCFCLSLAASANASPFWSSGAHGGKLGDLLQRIGEIRDEFHESHQGEHHWEFNWEHRWGDYEWPPAHEPPPNHGEWVEKLKDFLHNDVKDLINDVKDFVQSVKDFVHHDAANVSPETVHDFVHNDLKDFLQNEVKDFVHNDIGSFVKNDVKDLVNHDIHDFNHQNLSDFVHNDVGNVVQTKVDELLNKLTAHHESAHNSTDHEWFGFTSSSDPESVFNTDRIHGNTTIHALCFINAGEIAPGNSPGEVNFTGDLQLTDDSTLTIELAGLEAGTGFDVINVAGDVQLDGDLRVLLLDDFIPTVGDEFVFLNADGLISGKFDDILLPTLPGKLAFQLLVDGQSVRLRTIVKNPEPSSIALWALLMLGFSAGCYWYRRNPPCAR